MDSDSVHEPCIPNDDSSIDSRHYNSKNNLINRSSDSLIISSESNCRSINSNSSEDNSTKRAGGRIAVRVDVQRGEPSHYVFSACICFTPG